MKKKLLSGFTALTLVFTLSLTSCAGGCDCYTDDATNTKVCQDDWCDGIATGCDALWKAYKNATPGTCE